jgi:hypothetical protein
VALQRLLLRDSQVQPLLLIFEDLHWIDSEMQALLGSLVERLPTARLLLLVNYRPEYQHGWGSKTYYTQLRLDSLPPASAAEALHALLGDDPSLVLLKQLLIERTEDNPFFLEESVRTLVEIGVLVGESGTYRLARSLEELPVPATVPAVLAARIDRLLPEDKRLLQTAVVVGTEVPWPLLQAIADLSDEALYRSLAHLQVAEFLYETNLFPEHAYTFKHALTHEVAYGSLLHGRRRALHASSRRWRPWRGTGWTTRWNGWRTMPCGARCGRRPWPHARGSMGSGGDCSSRAPMGPSSVSITLKRTGVVGRWLLRLSIRTSDVGIKTRAKSMRTVLLRTTGRLLGVLGEIETGVVNLTPRLTVHPVEIFSRFYPVEKCQVERILNRVIASPYSTQVGR